MSVVTNVILACGAGEYEEHDDAPWQYPDEVQVFVKEQEDDVFTERLNRHQQ